MKSILLYSVFLILEFSSSAQLVQWRGPNRDGIFPETGLLKVWPEGGPQQILEVEKIGKGWSSPIPDGDMIYCTGMIDTLDYLSAVDMHGNINGRFLTDGRGINHFPIRCIGQPLKITVFMCKWNRKTRLFRKINRERNLGGGC